MDARWHALASGTPIWLDATVQDDKGVAHVLPGAPPARDLAALGVAYWEDITDESGAIIPYTQFVKRVGLKNGKAVGDHAGRGTKV